jgi:nitrite reductase (NADH) small subunit
MRLHKVAKVSDFVDLKPILAEIDGASVAVYRLGDRYYAYLNQCPHQGGPSCEGIVVPNVRYEITDGGYCREISPSDQFNIACPWHGVEFDLESGICLADRRLRLKRYDVVVESEDVAVSI